MPQVSSACHLLLWLLPATNACWEPSSGVSAANAASKLSFVQRSTFSLALVTATLTPPPPFPKSFSMSWQLVQTMLKRPPKPHASLTSPWKIGAEQGHHVAPHCQGLHCACSAQGLSYTYNTDSWPCWQECYCEGSELKRRY